MLGYFLKIIGGIGLSITTLIHFIIQFGVGLITFFALLKCCDVWWNLPLILDIIVIITLSSIPGLNVIMYFIGTMQGWGWGFIKSLLVLTFPYIFLPILCLILLFFIMLLFNRKGLNGKSKKFDKTIIDGEYEIIDDKD